MEAAELESVEKRNRRADGMILAFSYSEETDDDSSSDDGERVAADIAAISSTCGTYAVSDKNGIRISTKKPKTF
jgi:hypothetical protein